MITKIKNLLIFIILGLLLTGFAEWQNNVLMNPDIRGVPGYISTQVFNTILLLFGYLLFSFLKKKYSLSKTFFIQFTITGIMGLLIEWFLVGNNPLSPAVQTVMFVYWGSFLSIPGLFIVQTSKQFRTSLLTYIIASGFITLIASLIALQIDPSKTLSLLTIIATWSIIYINIIGYLFKALGYRSQQRKLLAISIIVPLAEVLLPFPFDFLVFIATLTVGYWYINKRLLKA